MIVAKLLCICIMSIHLYVRPSVRLREYVIFSASIYPIIQSSEGSRQQLNRYGFLLQWNFLWVHGSFTTILFCLSVLNLRVISFFQEKNLIFLIYPKFFCSSTFTIRYKYIYSLDKFNYVGGSINPLPPLQWFILNRRI